jgi:hypothetical protein
MTVKQVFNTSAELDYPTVLPTLDLDFANSKTLDPRITFTRASGGSYVGADGLIKYAGVNEARFDHDPETGESLGLLIEGARTNLITNSNTNVEFSNAANPNTWISGQLAPDGSSTAKLCITNNRSFIQYGIPSVNNVDSTFSIYLKTTGSVITRSFRIELKDISSDTVRTSKTITITPNWQRFDITGTVQSNGIRVEIVGDILNIFAWGAQLEPRDTLTSYIPTQGSARTRAVDNASITGKNFSSWYRQDEGSIFIDFLNTPYAVQFPVIYSISDPITGEDQNRVRLIKRRTTNSIRISDVTNGITQSAYDIVSEYNFFDNIKVIRTYGFKNYIGSLNGTTPRPPGTFNVTNPTPSKLMSTMHIGTSEDGFNPINAPIKRLTYYPKALPPSQLQALTS